MHLPPRPAASSGWLPASILAIATVAVVARYDTPVDQIAVFAAYVVVGLALPGTLIVRWLRGRSAHISEDVALGLAVGYCLEIATYIPARAIGIPLLVVVWPIATLLAFLAVPRLRRHWHGSGEQAPAWWSWSLAVMLGYLLVYSAGTYFVGHRLSGPDAPFIDMPYHLALIGELKHHVPPQIPYVTGVPLAYHWFFYVDAAAASWVTGIEPVTLLYRLSGLPMFVAFVLLTAAAARRIAGGWWSGVVAIAVALFGTVAGPYLWTDAQHLDLGIRVAPVFDTQTLLATWTSPTNLFGLALFAGVILVFVDLLHADSHLRRSDWLLPGLLVFGVAGAKASLLPLLIVGMATVIAGTLVSRHHLHRVAAIALALTSVALVLATVLLFRGESGGLILGIRGLQANPIAVLVGARSTHGLAVIAIAMAVVLVAASLWSLLWLGAYGLFADRRRTLEDPRILMVLGICIAGLGAVTFFLYPGLSELYYLRGAAGALGLITAAGIAVIAPRLAPRGPLIAVVAATMLVGAAVVTAIRALGPSEAPFVGTHRLPYVLIAMIGPILVLLVATSVTYLVARRAQRRWSVLVGAAPVLAIAMATGFSLPNVASVLASPFNPDQVSALGPGLVAGQIPAEAIAAARWLRDHSDPNDVVATNLHCRLPSQPTDPCDSRHFWLSAYAERRILIEGWAYTPRAADEATRLHLPLSATIPFWDPPLLALNDLAFSHPSAPTLAALRDDLHVHWLFADLANADPVALAAASALSVRIGEYGVYELP